MLAPTMYPATSKLMRINFPWKREEGREFIFLSKGTKRNLKMEINDFSRTNLEELSFLTVFALPKASRMGLACSSCFSNSPWDTHNASQQPPVARRLHQAIYFRFVRKTVCIPIFQTHSSSQVAHWRVSEAEQCFFLEDKRTSEWRHKR